MRRRWLRPGEGTSADLYSSLTGKNVPGRPPERDGLSVGQLLFALASLLAIIGLGVVAAWPR